MAGLRETRMWKMLCRGKSKQTKLKTESRGHWANKLEYRLAVAGAIVGLGNVWRFPYLCYKNGGGAFLVPYVVFSLTCGIPLFLLETSIGQYTQEGSITCWRKLCPLIQGVGYGGLVILLYSCMTYIIILAWGMLYLIFSFQSPLPWMSCNNEWNTENCVDFSPKNTTANATHNLNFTTSAAREFWERRVLALSAGIEEVGSIRWEMVLCLIILWVICYFCIWKGVRSTGKAVYVTATVPYLTLFILLVRGLTLPGAVDGIIFYLLPDPSRLTDPQVWMDAGAQIFFSYSLSVGSLIMLSSYNKYNNNCYKDSLCLCFLNSCTSLVAGFAVFSVLGFMAEKQGVPIAEVAESGPGLAFIAYPQAVAMMPLPQLWAICFFIMLILLGLDTEFVAIEVVMTGIIDMFPQVLRRKGNRERMLALYCLVCFLSQLVMVSEGGIYIFQVVDYYACSGACIFFLAVFESLAMGWLYGAERVCNIIEDMTGSRPHLLFQICWRYLTPLMTIGTFTGSIIVYQPLTFSRWYVYPDWVLVLGWLLAISSIILVPGCALFLLCTETGTLSQRLRRLCRPYPALEQRPAAELAGLKDVEIVNSTLTQIQQPTW